MRPPAEYGALPLAGAGGMQVAGFAFHDHDNAIHEPDVDKHIDSAKKENKGNDDILCLL
jgi:hypothetical protein